MSQTSRREENSFIAHNLVDALYDDRDEYASSDDESSASDEELDLSDAEGFDHSDHGDLDHSDEDEFLHQSDEEDSSNQADEENSSNQSDEDEPSDNSEQEQENRDNRAENNNRETEKERMKRRIHVLEMRVFRLERTLTETKNQLKLELIKKQDFGKEFLKSAEKIQQDAEEGKTKATFIMDQVNTLINIDSLLRQ